MPSERDQTSTDQGKDVLVAFAVLALGSFIALYVGIWEANPLIPALVTLILAAVIGILLKRRRKENGLVGALLGGAVGANVAVALHCICGYTLVEGFEDEGLGLIWSVLVFAPYATPCGIAGGGLVWIVAALFESVRKLDLKGKL